MMDLRVGFIFIIIRDGMEMRSLLLQAILRSPFGIIILFFYEFNKFPVT